MMRGGGFGGLWVGGGGREGWEGGVGRGWGWGRGGMGKVKKAQDPLFFARICFTVL
jgi:hypothetical protein